MKVIYAIVSMFALVSGTGKGGSSNGFPGNSGSNGHGQNHEGTFPGQGNFPGGGHGNGGEFPGNSHGNGNGNGGNFPGGGHGNGGNGNGGNGNGNGGNFPGGGHGNGNGGGNGHGNGNGGGNGHGNGNGGGNGNGNGNGELPPVPGPVITPGGSDGSLGETFGKYLVLKAILGQNNNDYDYDYAPPKVRAPLYGPCVTGPVVRKVIDGRKLLCGFDGSCPVGSGCQNGLCCHLTTNPVSRRRRIAWP